MRKCSLFTKVLTDSQITKIHDTSLAILERVGVHVPHQEMLRLFADADASVDFLSQRVKIPAELVMRCISDAGKFWSIYGRDISLKVEFGAGKRNYNSIAGEALWIDNLGDERRYATLDDVATATRCADALDMISIPGAMSDPCEIPVSYRTIEVAATMLRNTTKPIHFWYHDRASATYLNELMIAVRGSEESAIDHPLWYPFLEPISPLRFAFNGIDLLFETAKLNLPVPIGPMAQMGISAPGTLAATMAQENAEILTGVCITQLIRKGMPVMYGGICHAFDMRTTQMIFGGPEQAIFGVAMTQLGKHYGFPVYINVGLTDAKRPDAQAGLEGGTTLALGASAGADIFGHFGISGVDQASSLDMLVFHNEMISYIESMLREVEVNDDTIGLDEILAVGPGGTYINRNFTAEHFRKELYFPRLLDRDYYDSWMSKGKQDIESRCRDRKHEILNNHEPDPIPDDLDKAINDILKSAKRNLS
ncbi:MAG: trimethylamine methyltransferase family protein [Armatimonadota bacterium]